MALRKSLFCRPSRLQSGGDGASINAGSPRPFHNTICLSERRNEVVASPIIRLLLPRGPSAILFRVWAFVVDSFERHATRPFSHIVKECRKIAPRNINTYTPPAVEGVGWIIGVKTSRLHALPRVEGLRSAHAVSNGCRSGSLSPLASTGGTLTAAKPREVHRSLGSAVAAAKPNIIVPISGMPLNRYPVSVSLAANI